MFKVVTDQLKVSQGWVRCGHCTEVFDGTAHLVPDDTDALRRPASTPEELPEPGPTLPEKGAQALESPDEPEFDPAQPEWTPARSFADRVPLGMALSGPDDAQDSAAEFDPVRWKRALLERQQNEAGYLPVNTTARATATTAERGFEHSDMVDSEVPDSDAARDVSFVRNARRKAFWTRPQARWSLSVLSLVLLSVLALQWMLQQKDSLAALEPRLAPLLQSMCRRLHCEIRPPRHIESLLIDSSSFSKIGPDAYKLSFTLKNTGVMALEIPALEVTLTDTRDQPVVRRVLLPAQFGASAGVLAAHSELAGGVAMKVSGDDGGGIAPSLPPGPLRVAGYRILAFYP